MSDDSGDLSQAIQEAAAQPAQVSADGLLVQGRPLPDLIEADKHLAGKRAADQPHRGLRVTRLIPPGSV